MLNAYAHAHTHTHTTIHMLALIPWLHVRALSAPFELCKFRTTPESARNVCYVFMQVLLMENSFGGLSVMQMCLGMTFWKPHALRQNSDCCNHINVKWMKWPEVGWMARIGLVVDLIRIQNEWVISKVI